MKKILSLILIFAITMGSATGCRWKSDLTEEGTQNLKMSMDQEPVSLDPQEGTEVTSIFVSGHVLEGLVRVINGEVKPGMAEYWNISEDGLTYTFHLRDAKWSDGAKVSSKNFYDGIQRLLDPNLGSPYGRLMGAYIKNGGRYCSGVPVSANKFGYTQKVGFSEMGKDSNTDKNGDAVYMGYLSFAETGVKIIDDNTLEITLENPTGYFIRLLGFQCFLPVRSDLVAAYGQAYCADVDKMAFNGPFIISQWHHEEGMILKKNPNYWDEKNIKLSTIDLPIIPEAKVALDMFNTGEIMQAAVPPEMAGEYLSSGKAKTMENGGLYWLQFNYEASQNKDILSNENFRKAISCAIDREDLAKGVLKNGIPAHRYIPTIISGEEKRFSEENPYDKIAIKAEKEKAAGYFQKALEELGLTKETFPTITLLGGDTSEARFYCEAVQDMILNTLGIGIVLNNLPSKQRLQAVREGDYQIAYANWFPDFDDPINYLDIWTTGSNKSNFSHRSYDEIIAQAKSERIERRRQDLLFEAEKLLIEQMVVVPSHFGVNIYVESDRVKNIVRSMIGPDPNMIYGEIETLRK